MKNLLPVEWKEVARRLEAKESVIKVAKDYGISRNSVYVYFGRRGGLPKKKNVVLRFVRWVLFNR